MSELSVKASQWPRFLSENTCSHPPCWGRRTQTRCRKGRPRCCSNRVVAEGVDEAKYSRSVRTSIPYIAFGGVAQEVAVYVVLAGFAFEKVIKSVSVDKDIAAIAQRQAPCNGRSQGLDGVFRHFASSTKRRAIPAALKEMLQVARVM